MINYNIFRIAIITGVSFVLSACGEGNNVDLVKGGLMDMNKTLTIGEAFDNYGECGARNWQEFETENGVSIVEFQCVSKTVSPFINVVKNLSGDSGPHLNITDSTFIVQWSINRDGETFQLEYVGDLIQWGDGKEVEQSVDDIIVNIQNVYSDTYRYDTEQFLAGSQGEQKYAADVISYSYKLLYANL